MKTRRACHQMYGEEKKDSEWSEPVLGLSCPDKTERQVSPFAMTTLTQTLRRRQAVVKYAKGYSVSKSSYWYNVFRPTIYKWLKRYDGHLGSLKDESRRPHHHPNQHTENELKQICNMRRRNPNAGIVVLWVKLRQKGYSRSISSLLKVLKATGQMAVKLPNPKYTPKSYE